MESLLVNAIIAFWLIAFGAMALFPLLLDLRSTKPSAHAPEEDQVISIQPVAIGRHMASFDSRAEAPHSFPGADNVIGRSLPGDHSGMAIGQGPDSPATVRAQPRDSHLPATPKTIRPTRRHAA